MVLQMFAACFYGLLFSVSLLKKRFAAFVLLIVKASKIPASRTNERKLKLYHQA